MRFHHVAITIAAALLLGCNSEEGSISNPPPGSNTFSIEFANPRVIAVNSDRHWALLLHGRSSPHGTALQLVDVASRSVLNTRILDYYDVFDVIFLPGDEACFAGRTQDRMEYAVQFFTVPDLELGARVMTADMAGDPGSLTADTTERCVYYSHAGGADKDGLYKILLTTKTLADADNDESTGTAFDNNLVADLFQTPGRVFYDAPSQTVMTANLGGNFITQIEAALWGTLRRSDSLSFPIDGTDHLMTLAGGLSSVRAEAMAAAGGGVYVFAGTSDGTAFLSRIEVNSSLAYPPETMPPGRHWAFQTAALCVHPRDDVRSLFILQRDSTGTSIGRYNLNNLQPSSDSPYRTRAIPDTAISALGLDTMLDLLIVGDRQAARLELIGIE
ncbi:MAG: hypothetical protein PHI18_09085 [bacterium]|nr:hypothetical protein [bacterium]